MRGLGSSERYYRTALIYAGNRDLSSAINCARISLHLNGENESALKLMGMCLYEAGELDEAAAMFADSGQGAEIKGEFEHERTSLERVREFVGMKKRRRALAELKSIPHRSVRVLNIEGCIYASAGNFRMAGKCFAEALEKDSGNKLALSGLKEASFHDVNKTASQRFLDFCRRLLG